MSLPSMVILPSTRQLGIVSFMRLMQRRNVDLPQPDGPMKAMTPLSGISTFTSFKRVLLAVVDVDAARDDLGRAGMAGVRRLAGEGALRNWHVHGRISVRDHQRRSNFLRR